MSKRNPAQPKKKRKLLWTLLGLGAATATGVALWKSSEPKEDPWADDYWENVAVSADSADNATDSAEPAEETKAEA